MSLRAEQLHTNSNHLVIPSCENKQETKQEVTLQPQDMSLDKRSMMPLAEQEQKTVEEVKQAEETERRQEPEGRQADTVITEHGTREVCMQALLS